MLRCLFGLLALLTGASALAADRPETEAAALDAVTSALCAKRVAVLGEAEHGDGRTEAFKVALIERLVTRCGFSAVLFEASFYEFVVLDRQRRAGRAITPDQVATAVGGLWKYDREFQPLLPFLAAQANADKLRLGGFDFQQGGREQDYSNFGVIEELSGPLAREARERCRSDMRDLLFKGPSAERRAAAAVCLSAIAALPPSADPAIKRERSEMLANLQRYAASVGTEMSSFIARRDREMFANFVRWMARWPARTKVIVWTATAHAARAPHLHKDFQGVRPFGAYLARRYGTGLFALGFAAQGGTTRGRPLPREIALPQADSLEAWTGTIAPNEAVFLNHADLVSAGTRPAGLFNHMPIAADWSLLLDGVVVFPIEAPAADIRAGH